MDVTGWAANLLVVQSQPRFLALAEGVTDILSQIGPAARGAVRPAVRAATPDAATPPSRAARSAHGVGRQRGGPPRTPRRTAGRSAPATRRRGLSCCAQRVVVQEQRRVADQERGVAALQHRLRIGRHRLEIGIDPKPLDAQDAQQGVRRARTRVRGNRPNGIERPCGEERHRRHRSIRHDPSPGTIR